MSDFYRQNHVKQDTKRLKQKLDESNQELLHFHFQKDKKSIISSSTIQQSIHLAITTYKHCDFFTFKIILLLA